MITWHRGYASQSIATVVIWALQSDASVTVSCPGGTVVMTSQSPGAVHQIYLATITGLTAGTSYPITVNVDSASDTGAVKTAPVAGSTFSIGVISCIDKARDMSVVHNCADDAPLYCLLLGDTPYMDKGGQSGAAVKWGGIVTVSSITNQTVFEDVETYLNHYKSMWNMPCFIRLGHNTAIIMIADDHEWGDDDFVGVVTDKVAILSGLTWNQNHFDNAQLAITAANQGNPPNTDAGIDTNAAYWRLKINDDAEIFCPDYIKYRAGFANDGFGGTAGDVCLGANQEAWLIGTGANGVIHTSTAAHKIIASSKRFYSDYSVDTSSTVGQPDSFHGNSTERNAVVAAFQNTTGITVLSGDRHTMAVFESDASKAGETFDFLDVGTGNAGLTVNGTLPAKAQGDGFSNVTGCKATYRDNMYFGYSLTTINGSGDADIRIKDHRSKVRWYGIRDPLTNVVSYQSKNNGLNSTFI